MLFSQQLQCYIVGSRVLRAMEMTMSEPKYMQTLIKQYGLCIEEVTVTFLLQDLQNMRSQVCRP